MTPIADNYVSKSSAYRSIFNNWKVQIMSTGGTPRIPAVRNRVFHGTIVGAIVSGIVFLACWLLAFVPLTSTHALIAIFTTSPATSSATLVQGLCWSLVFGAWVGFLIVAVSRFVARITGQE